MTDESNRLQEILKRLETERDELRVQLNLAKLEARDEWDTLEKKMDTLRGRVGVLASEAKEASGDVGAAAETLAEEIKDGFSRMRKLI